MKISILTTVWKRPGITLFHFDWMNQFIDECESELGLDVRPFYILSGNDPYQRDFIRKLSLMSPKFTWQSLPAESLSHKTQMGLWMIHNQWNFDYLMHLDSDEIISIDQMKLWKQYMTAENPWFGSPGCIFYDLDTLQTMEFAGYGRHPVVNGGSCVHRKVLASVNFYVWMPGMDKGLNRHEHIRFTQAGWDCSVIKRDGNTGIVEIKGGGNEIHDLSWFTDREYDLPEVDPDTIYEEHPYLASVNLYQDAPR